MPERLSVAIDEINEQRSKGWPDFHPEDFCHRCGGKNVWSWSVDSDRFNLALGEEGDRLWQGIVCPGCFVELHEEATGLRACWRLEPDPQTPFRWIDDELNAPPEGGDVHHEDGCPLHG